MPRRWIKKWAPDKEQLERHGALRIFKSLLEKHYLWRIERKSVARAVAAGWIVGCAPIIGQTPLAVMVAYLLRANIPVTVFMAWTTNPVTIPPLVYLAHKIGNLFLRTPIPEGLEWNVESLEILLKTAWEPILLGLTIIAAVGSVAGYFFTHLLWKTVVLHNRKRQLAKRKNKNPH